MNVEMAFAAAIAQVSAGYADAVFPAPGAHVTYAIHDTLPRGDAYDETLTLAGPTHPDRSLGMGFHLLEVTNAVVQAGLAGKSSVVVHLGPPNAPAATLQVRSHGGTITASGSAALPPPPATMGEERQGPPLGERTAQVEIVATVVGGKLSSARGEVKPQDSDRGPAESWTVSRTP